MKTKVLLFLSVWSLTSLMSCSDVDKADGQVDSDYSQILAEAKPYISSGMQELINKLDTITAPIDIEEVIPFIDKILEKDSLTTSLKVTTRANVDGTTVTSGYSKTTTLFSKKAVTISNSDSPLRESLGYAFKLYPSSSTEIVYLTCKAICNYVYFSDVVSFFPAYAEGDFMGITPEAFNTDITNNSTFEQGYYSEEKVTGRLYYLTTYIFEAYLTSDSTGLVNRILPANDMSISEIGQYCNRLQWRYYVL